LIATVEQLLEPAVELEPWMTVSDLAARLRLDEPGFLRRDDGWEAVLPHLLVAQPASRRVIDVPRLSIEAVPLDAIPTDLLALLDRTTPGSSPVVDGTVLVGRLDHQRLRAWLARNAETDVTAELSRLRFATLAMLHELANVLSVIKLAAEKQDDPGAREAVSQAAKLVQLLRSLHGGAPITSTLVDVGEVVTQLHPLARAIALGVVSVARVELGYVEKVAARCPPALLERALIGLVMNSSEATIDSGTLIRIDVDADEREVRLRVSDDGPGLADHLVPRLFEPGFTTKKSAGPAARGTGLASLREAARCAGGDLRFERGKIGATFVLALPRASFERAR
jgi:signal transduction histidine kinase